MRAGSDPVAQQESAVGAFLQEQGWVPAGAINLTIEGGAHAMRYTAQTCAGEIRVAVLSPVGQDAGIVNDMAGEGERLLFVDQGVISETPPHYAPLRQKLGRLFQSVHLTFLRSSPYLAIAAPAGCPIETDVPWRVLR